MGIMVLAVTILISCSQGLKLSPFSRAKSLSQQKQTNICEGNPCPPDRPFLCKSSPVCVELKVVCNGIDDCPDGFDENSASCGLEASRLPLKETYDFLKQEQSWMQPVFFNGADLELVAREFTVAHSLTELKKSLSLTPENAENLRTALMNVRDNEDRPLIKMGMPENSWPDIKFFFTKLLDTGFKFENL